jgi:aminoglycoside 6'-N-acetyltransferase I
MRHALWPEGGAEEHAEEIGRYFRGELPMPLEVLLAFGHDGAALGFVELSIRPYAEGCVTDRVAYLEGWYVVPGARRRGVGRDLVRAAETWAARQGCTELASDALLDNEVSAAAHAALGFEVVERITCFRKDVAGAAG